MPACMQRHCLIGDNGALGGGVGGARGGARGGEGGGARGDQAKENSIAPPASGSLGQPARAGATAGRIRLPADKAKEVSRVLTSVTALRGSLPPAPPPALAPAPAATPAATRPAQPPPNPPFAGRKPQPAQSAPAGTPPPTKKRARRSASAPKPRRRKGSSAEGGKGGKAAAQKPQQRKQRRVVESDSETDEEDEDEDEEEFLIEEITAHRRSGSSVEYLVRWAPVDGEEESEQTWELLANVRTTEALEAYLSRQHTGGASK